MAEKKIKDASKKSPKKKFRKRVEEKLATSLSEFRTIIGEKKFDVEIKKFSQKLAAQLAKALPKKLKKMQQRKKDKA